MINAYWLIGRDIVQDEQQGAAKASYGKNALKMISLKLSQDFGKGFSVDTLERARKFYLLYASGSQSLEESQKSAALPRKSEPPAFKPNLT